jgi:hypothetical protein
MIRNEIEMKNSRLAIHRFHCTHRGTVKDRRGSRGAD